MTEYPTDMHSVEADRAARRELHHIVEQVPEQVQLKIAFKLMEVATTKEGARLRDLDDAELWLVALLAGQNMAECRNVKLRKLRAEGN